MLLMLLECLSRIFKRSFFIFGFLGMWTDWTLQTSDVQRGSLGPSS